MIYGKKTKEESKMDNWGCDFCDIVGNWCTCDIDTEWWPRK